MIHLYYSSQDIMAKEMAKRAVKKILPERNDFNYIAFDLLQSSIQEAVSECEFLPFGCEKKVVVLENCGFLKKGARFKFQKGEEGGKGIEILLNYLIHPNEAVDLFLLCYSEQIDKTSSIFHAIEDDENNDIQGMKPLSSNDWVSYIANFFAKRGVKIDPEACRELSKRINGDYGSFLNETSKLLTYAAGSPIHMATIETLVPPYVEDDAYKISNALSRGDKRLAIQIYQDLKKKGAVEEVYLINMLANQFAYLDKVRYLDSQGLDSRQIASELGDRSSMRAEIAVRNLFNVREDSIPKILNQLYRTEKLILSGEASGELSFNLFLANFQL